MKKFATVLAAGALALGAGLFVLVETTDLANAASRGGGGGRSFSGGGGRSFSGGGGRSFSGGGGRAVSARHVSPTRSSVGARRVGTTKHVNVGRTNTARRGNVGKGSSVKHVNIGNTRTNKHVNIGNTKNTGKHVNIGNTNTGKHVNIGGVGPGGLKAGPGGLKHGPGNLATGPGALGKGGPGGLKAGPGGLKAGPGGLKTGGLKPPPGGFKPNPGKVTVINKKYVNIFRGPRQIWWAGAWVSLAALAVIPAIYIGDLWYEPDGYVALAEPVCSGLTPEGYRLTWRDVPTDDGGTIPQCVAYYPRGRAAPAVAVGAVPGQAVGAAQPVAAAMAQGCLVEIYAQVSFTGTSSDVAADQPRLNEYGWDKQISSLDVKSGTWDFYSEQDYGGQMVRLPPGQYANLEGWDKQISSFMCAQPK